MQWLGSNFRRRGESVIRILINAIPLLSKLTGIGNCIYYLSRHLLDMEPNNKYVFYYGYFSEELQISSDMKDLKFRAMKGGNFYLKKIPIIHDLVRGMLREYHGVLSYGKKFDVYFEPNFIPLDFRARRIVTNVYDFSFHTHPEWHAKDKLNYFRKFFFPRIYKSDLIITDSNFAREEAKEFLKVEDDRIRVIYMGYDESLFRPKKREEIIRSPDSKKLPQDFVLFVGSMEPRKNLIGLLRAYLRLPERIKKNFKLLLVGSKRWKNADVFELLNQLKENAEYLGYVNNEELADLYRKASCFVCPSLYEGFGLPVLEAMACGCPVVASNMTSLPEVCGDAACYVDPYDLEYSARDRNGTYR